MIVEQAVKDTDSKMESAIAATKRELGGVRTGRASLTLLDPINVEVYGAKTPLKHLANLSTPDSHTIIVHPWDKTVLSAVEKAILKSELGLTPMSDGTVIRINVPPLTEERRKDLVKLVKKLAEEGRVTIRSIRQDANKDLKAKQKEGDISEDDEKRGLDKIQKLTDEHIKVIDTLMAEKEQEIMKF